MQHLYQVGHLALQRIVGDGVVPGVRHALPVDAEHAGGQSVQLARACLDVILCVVLICIGQDKIIAEITGMDL